MASMRDIKRRKGSIQSTQQITKAMKLVSTVKLQRAKQRAEQSQAYFDGMYKTVQKMLAKSGNIDHPYLTSTGSEKQLVIMITSNRGLAGGYNSNVVKLVTQGDFTRENVVVTTVGKKGRDAMQRLKYEVAEDYSDVIEEPTYQNAMEIARQALELYSEGKVGEIYLAYTHFKNTVVQQPVLMKLLPVEAQAQEEKATEDNVPMNFEPEEEEALGLLIPKYVTSLIYGGMVESVASENGARMQAMDSATNNAEEMISDLTLLYYRARQGSITQELTEIIAGAQAIS